MKNTKALLQRPLLSRRIHLSLWRSVLVLGALAAMVAPAANAQSCGCYELRELCGKVGGVAQPFASHGLHCVVDGQSSDSVATLSYRMQDFPKDCEMFEKKLANNLGERIKERGLACSMTGLPSDPTCPCNDLYGDVDWKSLACQSRNSVSNPAGTAFSQTNVGGTVDLVNARQTWCEVRDDSTGGTNGYAKKDYSDVSRQDPACRQLVEAWKNHIGLACP